MVYGDYIFQSDKSWQVLQSETAVVSGFRVLSLVHRNKLCHTTSTLFLDRFALYHIIVSSVKPS